jgi:hypothetical protein
MSTLPGDQVRAYATNQPNTAFYTVTAVSQCILFVVFTAWYLSRRRNNPIYARQPLLAIAHFTCGSVVSISMCVANAMQLNAKCLGMILAVLAGAVGMCIAWTARVCLLAVSRITTRGKVKVASIASLKELTIWEKHTRRGWRLALAVLVLVVGSCVIGASIWLVNDQVVFKGAAGDVNGAGINYQISQGNLLFLICLSNVSLCIVAWFDIDQCGPRFEKVLNYIIFPLILLSLITTILVTTIWFKPNRGDDNFYLLGELYLGIFFFSVWSLNLLMEQLVPKYITDLYGTNYDYGTIIFVVIPQLMSFLVILVHPIAKSYTTEFNPAKLMKFLEHSKLTEKLKKNRVTRIQLTKDLVLEDFLDFIHDSEGFSSFLNFLVSEWSVENLICWRDVTRYKSNFSKVPKSANLEECLKIYKKYFVLKKPLIEVNVSAEAVIPVRRLFSALPDLEQPGEKQKLLEPQLTGNEFAKAERELVRLMYGDTFQRYRLKQKDEFSLIRARLVYHTITPSQSIFNMQDIEEKKQMLD